LTETRKYSIAIDFQFCFRLCHREVKENEIDLELNGTHQLLVYADDANLYKYHKRENRNTLRG
jgi:hypothetical protein